MYEERGMSYRKISKRLNHSGIKTHQGNTWGVTGNSVYSVLKRMKEREQRLNDMKYKTQSEITNFKIYD
jgi:transposase